MKTVKVINPTVADTLQLFYDLKKTGSIFTAEFVKVDNSVRVMNCRTGVKKYKKGGSLPYVAAAKGLLPVFDMQKLEYRMVNLNTVRWIEFRGTRYMFQNN